ncbi:MAG: hypothetical protein NFCOHLIN_02739 [Gammaproteobacteria bacterium]|nr:hypothetical protein [Gammaproteobacteria bacterium]
MWRAAQMLVLRRGAHMGRALRLRFTPSGRAILAAAIVATAFGIDISRTRALQVAAAATGLLLVAAVFLLRRRLPLALSRELPRYGTVGVPLTYALRITNLSSSRALPEFELIDELTASWPTREEYARFVEPDGLDGRVERWLGFRRWLRLALTRRGGLIPAQRGHTLPPRAVASLEMTLQPLRRGYLHFGRASLCIPDPLGLINALQSCGAPDRLLILPRRYAVPPLDAGMSRRHQAGRVRRASNVGDSQEFLALREYMHGDALRHIHWRSWARTGAPIVKQFENEYLSRLALVIDTCTAPGLPLEAALSIGASYLTGDHPADMVIDLMLMGPRLFESSAGRGLGTVDAQLALLACAEPAPPGEFHRFMREVLAVLPRISAAIVVLPHWDEARRAFLRALRARGVPLQCLVTARGASPAPVTDADGVLEVRPESMEEDLARHRAHVSRAAPAASVSA